MSIRRPYVAGAFYPGDMKRLIQSIEECYLHKLGPGKLPILGNKNRTIIALVCPHAAYMYSGPVAAHSYLALSEESAPETAIILCPNHTGLGSAISIMGKGVWETPLGKINIDESLAQTISQKSNLIKNDISAHIYEHSIEVQLPFLQHLYQNNIKLIPICMGYQDLDISTELGKVLAESTKNKNVIIIASTDLNHQESQQISIQKDKIVLECIKDMDEKRLQNEVKKNRITMCGYGPVSAALVAAKILGANKTEILSHQTSGDITGDLDAVVGYAAATITRMVQ